MNRLLADARVAIERCATGQPFNLLPLEAQAVIDEMARLREKEFVFDELLTAIKAAMEYTAHMEYNAVFNDAVYEQCRRALAMTEKEKKE